MTATPPRADQVAPSPQSLCDHPVYAHHMRGGEPLTIPLCQICGEIGWDDLREQMAEHRRMVLEADQPEPCPLDHSCDEGEMCSCWCDLHDCPIAECPTFTLVERWITDMRTKHEATVAGLRRMVLTEAVDDLHRVATHLRATNPDSSVAKGVRYAEARMRAQLTAAPPAGPSATVPAENAPAVPEEADGQRAGQGDGQGWTVTAWRCDCHEWTWTAYFSDRQWFPMNAGLRVYGEQPARTLADLRSAHPNLTPVAVDDVSALVAERDRLAGEVFTLTNSESLDVVAAELERDEARADRDRLAYQVAHYQRVLEQVRAIADYVAGGPDRHSLISERLRNALPDAGTQPCVTPSDAKSGAGPHQHECACNRNWGGPCGPCVCEEPPRQGVWRLTCGAENIPPNQTYATKGAAEDVMRLHDAACPGTHGVEFVPDADTDQTEGEHA